MKSSYVSSALSIFISMYFVGCCCCDRTNKDSKEIKPTVAEIKPKYPSKLDAWNMSHQFVEKTLRSPSTADYGSLWDGTSQNYEKCVTDLGGNKFSIIGWVDSQNAFGTVVRTNFSMTLQYMGNDTWKVLAIKLV
jgi:hypothetical protein